MKYFWQGHWISANELKNRIDLFRVQDESKLDVEWTLSACEALSQTLKQESLFLKELKDAFLIEAPQGTDTDFKAVCLELSYFLSQEKLQQKVVRELASGVASRNFFSFERIDYQHSIFESWVPMGFLVHIAPKNSLAVPFLSLVEGLLAGNINFLKLPHAENRFTLLLVEKLVELDASQRLKDFILTGFLSLEQNDILQKLISSSDGVVAWGTEDAIQAIRNLTPLHIPVIPWGPKISFAYFSKSHLEDNLSLSDLVKDICILDQQSCSSPQVVYLETEDKKSIQDFAVRLSEVLHRRSGEYLKAQPSFHEAAQLTQVEQLHRMNQAWDPEKQEVVIKAMDSSWRVLIDDNSVLRASPLFRTIWVKPLLRKNIVATLRPLRAYLQSVGLNCEPSEVFEISKSFFKAGCSRVTPLGEMNSGYIGEPHDGVYALQRYSRKVSVVNHSLPPGISRLEDLCPHLSQSEKLYKESELEKLNTLPIQNSNDITAAQLKLRPEDIEIYFKTGGTSGTPKLSIFTYDDYEIQMRAAAQGLFAAGLEPQKDRCMNLFFAGGLYGGFLSFFSILEHLKAVQLPMAADSDFEKVGQWIVDQKVTVLLGMPSYLWQLLNKNEKRLTTYKGIKKIFYGGEHFPLSQRKYLKEHFGIEVIKSATYGSNETGPMGYQCQNCEGSVHHLHESLQTLEILQMDQDIPVLAEQPGRLIITSKVRHGQSVTRYEIGDIGRWVLEPCTCGRSSRRFELLGRYGDVFKVSSIFLNAKNFLNSFEKISDYTGLFQLVIPNNNELIVNFSNSKAIDCQQVQKLLLENDKDLNLVVNQDQLLQLSVNQVHESQLIFAPTSGKLKTVIDLRKS